MALFKGKENAITMEHLLAGETCQVKGIGQSMTPILQSGQEVIVSPIKDDTVLSKKDIVFCKVKGHFYLHLILAIRGDRYRIGNNHGHSNGWIGRKNIYGKVTEILHGKEN